MAENMSKNKYLKYFSIIKSKNVNDVMIQKCKRCYDTRQLTTNITLYKFHTQCLCFDTLFGNKI